MSTRRRKTKVRFIEKALARYIVLRHYKDMDKAMQTQTLPGAWPHERLVRVLSNAVARAMIAGRPTPVAARVLARLENER